MDKFVVVNYSVIMQGKNVKKDLRPADYNGTWCNLVNKPCIGERNRDCTWCFRNTAVNYDRAKKNGWVKG